MLQIILFVIFLSCLFANSTIVKVINGQKVQATEYPFAASLMKKSNFRLLCGGSVLNIEFILTACHCLVFHHDNKYHKKELGDIIIVAGSVNRIPGNRGQIRFPDMAIIHKNCQGKKKILLDAAIIRVTLRFKINLYLKPMPIFSKNVHQLRERTSSLQEHVHVCQAIGWGKTKRDESQDKYMSDVLLHEDIKLLTSDKCEDSLAHLIALGETEYATKTLLCAKSVSGNSSMCNGDSGGPLICSGNVYGITSEGWKCSEHRMPTLFQSIASVLDLFQPLLK